MKSTIEARLLKIERRTVGRKGRTIVIEASSATDEAQSFAQVLEETGVAVSDEDTVIRIHPALGDEPTLPAVYCMPIGALMNFIAVNGRSICDNGGVEHEQIA